MKFHDTVIPVPDYKYKSISVFNESSFMLWHIDELMVVKYVSSFGIKEKVV